MTKKVKFITMKKFFHKDTLITDFDYVVQEKEIHQTKTGTFYYSSNRQLKYDGEPSITFTFPAGKLCAYSFDMTEQETLKAMLKEMERPIKNKICMYLRKRDIYNCKPYNFKPYKKQYNALLEEALAEHKSYKEAMKKFAEEHNFS